MRLADCAIVLNCCSTVDISDLSNGQSQIRLFIRLDRPSYACLINAAAKNIASHLLSEEHIPCGFRLEQSDNMNFDA